MTAQRKAVAAADLSANRLRASIVDLTFAIWLILVPTVLSDRLLNSDGDIARHIRMGRHILAGGLRQPDVFSHTMYGAAFVPTEWLSQVYFALADGVAGLAGVGVAAAFVIAATYALVVLFQRRAGVDPLLAYLAGIAAAVLGSTHWLARPHLFTLLGLATLLFILEGSGRRRLMLVGPLFAVWSNFHPGFVIGLAALGAFIAGDRVEAMLSDATRAEWLGRARYHTAALGLGVAGACFNPQGPAFFLRIARILGDPAVAGTNEFVSPDFHTITGAVFLAVIVGIVVILALTERRPALPRMFLLIMMLAAALYAGRNIAIFGVTVLPVLALEWSAAWSRLGAKALVHVRGVFARGERVAVPGRWVAVPAIVMIALALNGGRAIGMQAVPDRFDAAVFPVEAVERAREAHLDGRIFNDFAWGGYLLYAWPEQTIFIDGMTDFFGGDVVREYLGTYWLREGWEETLRRRDISLVLLPPGAPLVDALDHAAGWSRWYADSVAVVLRRSEPAAGMVQR